MQDAISFISATLREMTCTQDADGASGDHGVWVRSLGSEITVEINSISQTSSTSDMMIRL